MKYFGQNTLAHHEMTSNLNKVSNIVDPPKSNYDQQTNIWIGHLAATRQGGICLGKQHYHFDALTIQKARELQLTEENQPCLRILKN